MLYFLIIGLNLILIGGDGLLKVSYTLSNEHMKQRDGLS